MNIFIFMPSLAGGGAERTIVNLANEFCLHGNTVHLALGKETNDSLRSSKYLNLVSKDVVLHRLDVPAKGKNILQLLISLRSLIKTVSPDLIFTTRLPSNLVVILATLGLKKEFKVVIRESVYRSATIKRKLYKMLIGSLYNKADKVISLSDGVRQDLINNFNVNQDTLEVIYNPIDLTYIESCLINSEEVNSNEVKGNRFIFIGRLDDQKSPIEAIEAFKQIKREIPNASLDVYGIGPHKSALLSYLEENKDLKGVSYHGFTDTPYLAFKNADFFLMPSKYEGFGHVIVESLACGCLPIVYDCPHGPSEILTDELSELLIPLGDINAMAEKAIYFANNKDKASLILKSSKTHILKFDKKTIANEYIKIFNELVHSK